MPDRITLNTFKPRWFQRQIKKAMALGAKIIYVVVSRQVGKTENIYKDCEDFALDPSTSFPHLMISASTIKQAKKLYGNRFDKHFEQFNRQVRHSWRFDKELDQYVLKRTWANPHDLFKIDIMGTDGGSATSETGRESDRGGTYNAAFLDEYGKSKPGYAMATVLPTLRARDGYMFVTGTPLGPNHFKDEFEFVEAQMKKGNKRFFALMMNAEQAVQVGDMSKKHFEEAKELYYSQGKKELFAAEFMCDWYAYSSQVILGTQMAKAEREDRIGHYPHSPFYPVDSHWDLGRNGLCFWLTQNIAGSRRYIMYKEILSKAHLQTFIHEEFLPLMRLENYNFANHFWPHDINFGEMMSKDTRWMMVNKLIKHGRHHCLKKISNFRLAVDNARRAMDRCYFDAKGCGRALSHLRSYNWAKSNKDKQDKNSKSSHCGDAFILSLNGMYLSKEAIAAKDYRVSNDLGFGNDNLPPSPIDIFDKPRSNSIRGKKGFYDK